MQPAVTTINIADITIDPAFQMRCSVNQEAVDDYADLIVDSKSAWPFNEPCTVFNVSGELILVDGFHRVAGMKTAGRDAIEATIVDGTRTDALLAAIGANQTHGLRRNSADKRRCVTTALGDELLSAMSDRQLAELCGVSQPFVSHIRSELITVITSEVIGADGKAYPTAATAKAKRAKIAEAVASNPEASNVKIAQSVGVSDKTVASVRRELAAPPAQPRAASPITNHPLLAVFPEMDGHNLDALKADIERYGQRLPIVIDDSGLVLDGRARLKACAKLNIAPKIEVFHGSEADKIGLIRSLNVCRATIDPSQQSMYIAHLVGMQLALQVVQV